MNDLIPVNHSMKAANKASINIDGAIILRLSGSDASGNVHEAAVLVYVSPDTEHFFLSHETMVQLGIITKDFPRIGSAVSQGINNLSSIQSNLESPKYAECGCLLRQAPPKLPNELPFPCTSENVERMKTWLLEFYASSAFNKCEQQRILEMEGPPLRVHIDKSAKPCGFFKPLPVPVHWKDQVE